MRAVAAAALFLKKTVPRGILIDANERLSGVRDLRASSFARVLLSLPRIYVCTSACKYGYFESFNSRVRRRLESRPRRCRYLRENARSIRTFDRR